MRRASPSCRRATQHFATIVLGDDVDGALRHGRPDRAGPHRQPRPVRSHRRRAGRRPSASAGHSAASRMYAGVAGHLGQHQTRVCGARRRRSSSARASWSRGRARRSRRCSTSSEIVLGGVGAVGASASRSSRRSAASSNSAARLGHLEQLSIRGVGVGRIGPLVAAAAVGPLAHRAGCPARCPISGRSSSARPHAARRTPQKPTPTARRSRRSSPRSCPPTGAGIGTLEGDELTAFVTRWRTTLYEAGYLAPGLAGRVRRRRAVGARAGDPRRGVRQGRRAHRRAERRVRHPDARQHPAAVRHRRTEGALPAADPVRARTPGARGTASPTPAPTWPTSACGPSSTATSGCSTVRRSGPRPVISPTTSSRSPAPTPTRRSTRASRSCWSTCASPASRSARSR